MISLQMEFSGMKILKGILLDLADTIPNLLIALLILIIGWIIASIVAKVIKKLLLAVRADKLGEQLERIEIVDKSGINIDIPAFGSKAMYYIILIIFMIVAVEKLGVEAITNMMADMIAFIPKLISAVVILIVGILFADKLKQILATSLKSLGVPSGAVIAKAIFYFLLINIFVVAMAQSGIDMAFLSSNLTVLIGGVALAFAIAYGFASRTVASNTISSFYAKDDIRMGQKITIEGITGTVVHLGSRNITMSTDDGRVLVPFSRLMEHNITIHES